MCDIIQLARRAGALSLTEPEGKKLVAGAGFSVPHGHVVRGSSDPDPVIGLKPPFAVKVIARSLSHKSDSGGVALNLRDRAEVVAAIARMERSSLIAKHKPDGFLVEEMVASGTEIVVGGMNHRQFGPIVMAGLGGIFVEILKDVQFRVCPVSARDAEDMLDSLRGAAMLAAARGRPAPDRAAIVGAILGLGAEDGLLLAYQEEIDEIDINPLIAGPDGAIAADVRIALRPQ